MICYTSVVVLVKQIMGCKVVDNLKSNCPLNQKTYLHQVTDRSIILGLEFIFLFKLGGISAGASKDY